MDELPAIVFNEQPLRLWQLCRICAGTSNHMIPIFHVEGKQNNLAGKIKQYLPITIDENDRLPLHICETCVRALEACHQLVQCCTQADAKLRNLLQQEEKMGLQCLNLNATQESTDKIIDDKTKVKVPQTSANNVLQGNHQDLSSKTFSKSIMKITSLQYSQALARNQQQHKNTSVDQENNAVAESLHQNRGTCSFGFKSKQFSCWECGITLEDLQLFMQHQKQVHSRELQACHMCENIFETESLLKKHCQEEHLKGSYEISTPVIDKEQGIKICPKKNKRKQIIHDTNNTQTSVRVTRASAQKSMSSSIKVARKNVCETPVDSTKKETFSMNSKQEEGEWVMSSSDGDLDVDDPYIPEEKSGPKASAYQCKICSKGYESKSGRRNHYVSAHDRHECKVCEGLFLTSDEAELHEKLPHKIACSHCPEYFQSQSSLKMHVSSKHLEGPKQYKCSQCGRDYVSKSALLTHEKLHKIKEPSICNICNKSCKTPTALKYHKFVHMTDEEKAKVGFACTMCEKKFPGKTRLTLHMRRHTDERPCECPTCHKTFHDSERLKAHMEGHSTEKRFKCDQCDACFVSKRYLVNHMYLSHRRRQVIRCVVCNIVFPSMKEVLNHQQTHTPEEIAQSNASSQPFTKSIEFHCKECNEYFAKKDLLRLHKARYHTKERIPHKSNLPIKQLDCKVCGKKVWGTAGLGRHMRVHTGEAPARTFQCEFCAKLFAQKMQMVLHIRTHTGEKPFRCQFCEKGFINVNSLVVHERIHTGENPFQCDKCPKAFRSNSNLVAHLQTHSDIKPYECHYCHKRFGRLIHLKLHLRTHTGERPYVCDICGRAFTQGGDMRKHRLTHTGERAYKCEMCDFSSNKRKTLSEHQLSVHHSSRPLITIQPLPIINPELSHHSVPAPPELIHEQNNPDGNDYSTQQPSSYSKVYENWSEN